MNTTWLYFALIVSGVIVFLGVITPSILHVIFSYRTNSKPTIDKRDMTLCTSKSAVWAPIVFLSVFLLLVGICIFSLKFSESSKLIEFVSLTSAIVSIILAVLTIVYSYYTTSASMKNLGKLEESADAIVQTSEQICNVSEQVDRLGKMIVDLKPYIEQEVQKIGKAIGLSNYDNAKDTQTTDQYKSTVAPYSFEYNKFLSTFSPLGILFLYMCVKCEKVRPIIHFQEIAKIFELNAVQYFMGILVTLNSLFGEPIVDVDYDNSFISVGQLDEAFKKAIEDRMGKFSLESVNLVKNILFKMKVVLHIDVKTESTQE